MNITIKEMGPRDGLQNESVILAPKDIATYIHMLEKSGLSYIEVGAFVHPKAIPAMAGTEKVLSLLNVSDTTETSVLVPNEKGMTKALENKCKEVAIFTAASETFNQKNIRASIEQSFSRFEPVVNIARDNNIKVRGYVSTAYVCPFEGNIKPSAVIPIIDRLLDMGCYEVSVGDTVGKATQIQVEALWNKVDQKGWTKKMAGHFHDTYQQALSNVLASIECGVYVFDTSAGGIGGCPYAPGASGNLGTEDLVDRLTRENYVHGVNLSELIKASAFIESKLGHPLHSKTYLEHQKA